MNKVQIFAFIVFCLAGLSGCGEKSVDPEITSLELKLSKEKILGDNIDFTSVTVLDQSGLNVRQFVKVYANGNLVTGEKIISQLPAILTVYAQFNNVKSNEVEIEVVEDKNLKFEKNVLLEQYTGTWCGWCPRAISQINILENVDKKVVHSALHLSDLFAYSSNSNLFQSFGFTGVPTVHADRVSVWAGNASELSALHAPSRVGMSIEVTGDKNEITAAVKIRFGYQFPEGLELSVYLLHDSLVADQANFYNDDPSSPYYRMGPTMANFVHRNVLLKAGTNMFGDAIPADSVDIGSNYSKNILFTNFRCDNVKMMRVIAHVTYQGGAQAGKVLNCIKANIGEKKGFVFVPK
jgi:thiol-disulfide isomerase/thioredoxin